jgi:cytochrome c-type biogenesis protein CcmH/NrfG/RNA polymerase subunit RPABC4/transcription elongation factor Spt4
MVKFCPECGYKLVQEFKFCPECGFELDKIKSDSGVKGKEVVEGASSTASVKNGLVEKKICDNCGEENDIDNIICSGCGVKLTGAKTGKVTINQSAQQVPAVNYIKPVLKPGASPKKTNQVKASSESKIKSLNKVKTITIIAIGTGVAVLVLIFSGVLNSIIIPGNNVSGANNVTPNTNTNQNPGVDLTNINKINDLEAVVKKNPKDTASILDLAHLKNDAGMFDQAIADYKQYLFLAPKDADARIDMGICYYNLQNYETAISEMELALKYDPKHQIGYLDLGIVNLSAGNMDKSQEWLKKAVSIDPNSEYGKKAQELLSSHNNQSNGGK